MSQNLSRGSGTLGVLDVSFRDDESRVRRDNAPENMAVFRHVFRSITQGKAVKAKRFKATLQAEYAQEVLENIF
ncbi:MAG: hypothetical protein K0U24_00100 [Gammaproteobacteria bacterium]|nr:hypothetical protein [Gammaproteobacteria bacterium]